MSISTARLETIAQLQAIQPYTRNPFKIVLEALTALNVDFIKDYMFIPFLDSNTTLSIANYLISVPTESNMMNDALSGAIVNVSQLPLMYSYSRGYNVFNPNSTAMQKVRARISGVRNGGAGQFIAIPQGDAAGNTGAGSSCSVINNLNQYNQVVTDPVNTRAWSPRCRPNIDFTANGFGGQCSDQHPFTDYWIVKADTSSSMEPVDYFPSGSVIYCQGAIVHNSISYTVACMYDPVTTDNGVYIFQSHTSTVNMPFRAHYQCRPVTATQKLFASSRNSNWIYFFTNNIGGNVVRAQFTGGILSPIIVTGMPFNTDDATVMCCSPNGQFFCMATSGNVGPGTNWVTIWDNFGASVVRSVELIGVLANITDMSISNDGLVWAGVGGEGMPAVYSTDGCVSFHFLSANQNGLGAFQSSCDVSEDGRWLVASGSSTQVWELYTDRSANILDSIVAGYYLILTDDGSVGVYTDDTLDTLLGILPGDRTLDYNGQITAERYVHIVPNTTVQSKNGIYILEYSDPNYLLRINIFNTALFRYVAMGQGRYNDAFTAYVTFCNNKGFDYDIRCECAGGLTLVEKLFKDTYYDGNQPLLDDLTRNAPCYYQGCAPFFSVPAETSIFQEYIRNNVDCLDQLVICEIDLNIDDSEINNLTIEQNCGNETAGNLGSVCQTNADCTSLNGGCNPSSNICEVKCSTNTNCPVNHTCINQFCVPNPPEASSDDLSAGAIAGIAIAAIIGVTLVIFGIWASIGNNSQIIKASFGKAGKM